MKLKTRAEKEKDRKKKKARAWIALLAVLGLVCVLTVSFFVAKLNMQKKNIKNDQEISQLKQEIENEKKRIEQLEEKKEYVDSRQYIEDMARSKMGLIYPDEIVFRAGDE